MKRIYFPLITCFFLFLSPSVFADGIAPFFGLEATGYLKDIDAIGPRAAGAKSEIIIAKYIETKLKRMGYTPERQMFSEKIQKKDSTILIESKNIIVIKRGLSERQVILAAHYDSVDIGHGADDNASGVAVLLEICHLFANETSPYTLKFVFFGAEEVGEIGSHVYVESMLPSEIDNTLVVINLDSLIAGDTLYIHGDSRTDGIVRDWLIKKSDLLGIPLAMQTGLNSKYPAGTTGDWGDQAPFSAKGMQTVVFEATNWELGDLDGYTQTAANFGKNGKIWHTKFDTLEYIEAVFPGRTSDRLSACSRLIYTFIHEWGLCYRILLERKPPRGGLPKSNLTNLPKLIQF